MENKRIIISLLLQAKREEVLSSATVLIIYFSYDTYTKNKHMQDKEAEFSVLSIRNQFFLIFCFWNIVFHNVESLTYIYNSFCLYLNKDHNAQGLLNDIFVNGEKKF